MFAKLGLVLLVIAFGLCTFVAGAMAPDAWRGPIAAFGARVLGQVPAAAASVSPGAAPIGIPPPVPLRAPAPAAETAAPAPGPVRLDSLLVTAAIQEPVPADGAPAYALQLGQFTNEASADAAMRRAEAVVSGPPLTLISAIDAQNQPWSVVAIGRYVSPDAAKRALPRMQQALDLHDMPVIRLPPAGKTTAS